MKRVRELSPSAINRLRSSATLLTFEHLVLEIVQNSVDADASRIRVEFDPKKLLVTVHDNGHGITWEDLQTVGQRYCTSKEKTLDNGAANNTYGFRGEALASISQVSSLTIITRPKQSIETFILKIKNGTVSECSISSIQLDDFGTRVHISDVFNNVNGKKHISRDFEMPVRRKALLEHDNRASVRWSVQAISLIHAGCISFTLFDADAQDFLFHASERETTLSLMKTYYGEEYFRSVRQVKEGSGSYKIRGFYSDTLARSKVKNITLGFLKILVVNNRWITHSDLYHLINQLIRDFCFEHSETSRAMHPVYFMHVIVPKDGVDFHYEPTKATVTFTNMKRIEKLLSACFGGNSNYETFFNDDFPGQKSTDNIEKEDGNPSLQLDRGKSKSALAFNSGPVTKMHEFTCEQNEKRSAGSRYVEEKNKECRLTPDGLYYKYWDDVKRGWCWINQRTGHCYFHDPSEQKTSLNAENVEANYMKRISLKSERVEQQETLDSSWAREKLIEWKNPVFETQYRTISHVEKLGATKIDMKLTKDDLKLLRVIGQVDLKFIACHLKRPSEQPFIVIVDQHAADERIRVEQLSRDFFINPESFTVPTIPLPHPLTMHLSVFDMSLFMQREQQLHEWGFHVVEKNHNAITISHVPTLFLARFQQYPDLLSVTLQSLLHLPLLPKPSSKVIPEPLYAVIASIACRGAVMFGDELSRDGQISLVKALSECMWPFGCAHGRPVCVPILALQQ